MNNCYCFLLVLHHNFCLNYSGYNESSQLLVTFCANFHIIASTQRYMYVVFVSDKSSSGAGFDLRYNAQLINPPSTLVLPTTTTEGIYF